MSINDISFHQTLFLSRLYVYIICLSLYIYIDSRHICHIPFGNSTWMEDPILENIWRFQSQNPRDRLQSRSRSLRTYRRAAMCVPRIVYMCMIVCIYIQISGGFEALSGMHPQVGVPKINHGKQWHMNNMMGYLSHNMRNTAGMCFLGNHFGIVHPSVLGRTD